MAEIAAAATRVTGIPADRILVVIQNSPAHFAIEGGRVLPAPVKSKRGCARSRKRSDMSTNIAQAPTGTDPLPCSGLPRPLRRTAT